MCKLYKTQQHAWYSITTLWTDGLPAALLMRQIQVFRVSEKTRSHMSHSWPLVGVALTETYLSSFHKFNNLFLVIHKCSINNKSTAGFSLSGSVSSIIDGMCVLFFLDPAQHNPSSTARLPSHAYKSADPTREQWVFPTARLHQWSHIEWHCCVSFEFYKHHNACALSSKCVY